MRFSKVCAGLLLAGGVIVTGCTTPDKPAEPVMPATAPMTKEAVAPMPPKMSEPVMPATAPVVAAPVVPAPVVPTPVVPTPVVPPKPVIAFTPTHMLTKDQPYYTSVPASPTAAPDGMFKAGTKVLLFSFSGMYSKVTVEDGTTAYTLTDGLDPISKK